MNTFAYMSICMTTCIGTVSWVTYFCRTLTSSACVLPDWKAADKGESAPEGAAIGLLLVLGVLRNSRSGRGESQLTWLCRSYPETMQKKKATVLGREMSLLCGKFLKKAVHASSVVMTQAMRNCHLMVLMWPETHMSGPNKNMAVCTVIHACICNCNTV